MKPGPRRGRRTAGKKLRQNSLGANEANRLGEAPSTRFEPHGLIPDPSKPLPAVFAKSATNYPLLYRKRLARADGRARAGDLVAVYDGDEQLQGYGIYNPRSEVVVRMLRHTDQLPDESFWDGLLTRAVRLRREMLRLDEVTNAYRVLHAEGDQLSGLVVDRFGDVLSAEAFSLGMYLRAQPILERLQAKLQTRHWLIQPSPQFLSQEGADPPIVVSPDLPDRVAIEEFGTRFWVKFAGGHKTGFFCDQRENRRRLAEFCRGKSVLDLCCYTGGFSVQAKTLGEAAEVTGVDLDAEPLVVARDNAKLNRVDIRFTQADAFVYMRDMIRNERQYDVVVLDPPKLIRSRDELHEGTRKHFDLNRLAFQLVRPGGLLLTCSCAGLLGEEEFMRLLYAAARQAVPEGSQSPGRDLQLLARTGAAADHPVSSRYLESEYLKAAWMIVH
ncbi:MAG: class I SAM-dependent rRNA methyltransferase [Planctomycetales bacterium]|nr:class I SAM-dependent rRNA methyltransferase [Planctomycetales bacterium]MCA9210424.1 class I SAM-dependent rRNA methyltransferase [Planctomycetales bacterium]